MNRWRRSWVVAGVRGRRAGERAGRGGRMSRGGSRESLSDVSPAAAEEGTRRRRSGRWVVHDEEW